MANDLYGDAVEQLSSTPAGTPAPAQPKNDALDWLKQQDAAAAVPLRQARARAADTDPDRAAKVQQLAQKLGMPGDVVDRHYEDLSKEDFVSSLPYTQIQAQTPALATWAAQPEHAAIAKDDMEQLGALEWLLKAPSRAVAQTLNSQEYGALRSASLWRDLTQDEQDRMNSAKLRMQDGGQLGTEGHWFRGALTGGIKLATMLSSTMPVYGLAGAAGGAIIGAAGGTLIEPGGGTVAGLVAGAKLGFEAGNVYGLGKMSFQTEAASSYDGYLNIKDEHGQPIDPKVARMAALATGAINSGLMLGAGQVIAKSLPAIPGLNKLGAPFIRDAVSKALQVPTVRAALMDAAKTYGATLSEGTALMVGMRAVSILGGELAKSASEQTGQLDYGYGPRHDSGQPKGLGFFGPLQRPDGQVMSEYSIGVDINGKEQEIPSLVPTLTREEVQSLINAPDGQQPSPEIIQKATAFAEQRLAAGKNPFADAGEQTTLYPELQRAATPKGVQRQFQHITPSETGQQLLSAAAEAAQSFALPSAIGPGLAFMHDAVRASRAQQAPAFYQALGEGVAQSKTAQRLPDAAREFIDQATKDGPIHTLYAPLDSNPENGQIGWTQYWQSKGVDPAEMAARVTGSRDAYDTAKRTGGDLPIPTSRYATTLAATEHNAHFANELRLGPDEMNGVESAKFAEQVKTMTAPPPPEPSPLKASLLERLQQAGVPASQAEDYASTIESMSGENGILGSGGIVASAFGPEAFQQFKAQYGLDVTREGITPEGQPGATPEGTPAAPARPKRASRREMEARITSLETELRSAQREGETDTLTGVANRKALDKALPAAEADPQTQVVAFDANNFGKVNKTLGHVAGDAMLKKMADAIHQAADEQGLGERVFRRGGDEFVVLAPGDKADAIRTRAEELFGRQQAGEHAVSLSGTAGNTFSEADASLQQRKAERKLVDKKAVAAQNPEGYYNAPRSSSPAQEGAGSGNAEGQQSVAHGSGSAEGAGDGARAEPGRPQTAGLPDVNEVFARRTQEEDAARVTPEVKRELARILDELQTFPYEGRQWTWLEGQKTGNAAGGAAEVRAGHAGAPVDDDVLAFSPLNKGRGGEPAKKVRGTRNDVAAAIDAVLKSGEIKSNLQEGAVRVAMNRAADNYEYLTPPSLPHADGPIASHAFTDALSEAIDRAQTATVDLLDASTLGQESDILEPDGPADTSFNIDEFNQSLFDKIDQPDPTVDTLTTGEQQPRLPGAEDVRDQNVETPQVAEAPFLLTSEIAKPRAGKQKTLFQEPKALTPENVQAWADEVQQRAGPDLQVFNVSLSNHGDLKLNMFAVDRGAQRAGLGSRAMGELTRFADLNGKRIVLSPGQKDDAWGTTSRSRLVKFYKRFGFVENTGRNADLSISEGMYREPTLPGGRTEHAQPTVDAEGNVLEQPKRGAIRFGPDRQFSIALLERADPSTFLHEVGHFFLEVMGDAADRFHTQDPETLTDAQRQLLSDYGEVLQHIGAESRAKIGVDEHEKWARSVEAYFMEGKAPAVELQGSFARFRAWLIGVYRSLSNLKVNLTPEVRGVLDRMLASERAIQDAEAQRSVVEMFTTPEAAGMTPEEFAPYRKTIAQASRTAREQLDAKLFADVARERQAEFRAQRADVKAEVENDVHQRPEYRAIAAMQRGTHPNGEPLVDGMETAPLKLDRKTLIDRFGGEDRLKRLPRGIVGEDGVDPELVARMFGFNSGDAMLKAVEHAPPMKAVIDQNVKQRMVERYGDTLLDGTLHEKAQAAVANEDRDAVIRAELKALNNLRRTVKPFVAVERKKGEAVADELRGEVSDLKAKARGGAATIRAGIPPAGLLRQAADDRINGLQIGSIQPQAFWSASRRSAQMAIDRAARQDFDGAIQAKTQELINVNLFRKAEAALEAVDAGVKFARSLTSKTTRSRIGLAGGGYLDQIDGLLDRYEFARVPDTTLARRASLRDWAEALTAQGLPADQIPKQLLDDARRINYREMTLDEFTGVVEGLRVINHLATLKNRLLKAQDAREFSQLREDLTGSIYANNERLPKKLEYSPADERFLSITGWFASHRKASNIVQALDGYADGGAFWTAFWKPINEAADTEGVRRIDEATAYMDVIDKHYAGSDIRTMQDKLDVPGVGSLSKEARLAVALNWGNQTSRDRLLSDPMRGWTRENIHAILDTLDKRDWDFVQDTWNYVGKFWEEIAAKQERVTGLRPEKVEAMPVETQFGTYDGGYYPLQYDGRLSQRVKQNELASQAKLATTAAYVRTTTKRGHVETRQADVHLPVRLDLSVVHNHVDQVLHDLTHHEVLIDSQRLLRDPKVSKAILETLGGPAYDQLTSALQDIALGGANGPRTALDKAATFMRSGTQISQLGWNFWTALQQPLGLFNGMARVGPTWIAKGAYRWLRDAATMDSTTSWINEVSPMMRERAYNATQDLSDLRMAFRQPGGWFDGIVRKVSGDHLTVQTITDSMLWHIGMAQRIADVPTWLGQYEKSMAAGETEDRAFRIADQAVLDSHGHGAIKDLSQVQRGGPVARLFMTFYSYGNTVFNATAREADMVSLKSPASVGRFLGHLGLLYVAPAMLTVAMQDTFGKKNPKDYLQDVGREGLAIALNTMVFVRELGALAQEGNRGYGGPAGSRFFELLDALGAQVKQGKVDEGLAKALNNVGGVLLHYPATQIERTIDGWAALEEGRTKNPAALIVGPPPKNQQH